MSLGSILLNSKKIKRAKTADKYNTLVQDLLDLVGRIAVDQTREGDIQNVLEQAALAIGERIVDQIQPNFASARTRALELIEPLVDEFTTRGQDLADIEDFSDFSLFFLDLLTGLAYFAEDLSVEQIREPVARALDIMRNDLGITNDFIEDLIWEFVDEVINRLKQMPDDLAPASKINRQKMISVLRRIKKQLHGIFSFPDIRADTISTEIIKWLREKGVDKVTQKAACIGDKLNQAVEAGKQLADLIPGMNLPVVFGPSTLGAAEAVTDNSSYCWYASWVMGSRYRSRGWYFFPFWPADDIWINETGNKMIRENFWREDEEISLTVSENGNWKQIPHFDEDGAGFGSQPYFTFDKISRDGMENTALYTAVAADFGEAVFHLLSIEKGDFLSNILNVLPAGAKGIHKTVTKKPKYHWAADWFAGRGMASAIGALQGQHTETAAWPGIVYYITKAISQYGEALVYTGLMSGARNAILSLLTLLNYKDSSNRPDNRLVVDGLADVVISLISKYGHMAVIPGDMYGHPFMGSGERVAKIWLVWGLLTGMGFGILGATAGVIFAELWSWEEEWSVLGWKILQAMETSFVMFWPNYFMAWEGKTDDGKLNPVGADFDGYPDHESSPYKLPWEADKSIYCPQGNQGFITHNAQSGSCQLYAYDFAMDQGTEILAARGGVVDAYYDDTDNDDHDNSWNYIRIRHTTQDTTHDKDAGGTVVTTYAEYGHGRKDSVEAAFAARGITQANIVGSTVTQGQVIMQAGNTGNSAYNHLHMHVRPQNSSVSVNTNYTIPFVFRDAKHRDLWELISQDGRPKTFNYYVSENTKIT